jgi:hypothetical protein
LSLLRLGVMIQIIKLSQNIDIVLPGPILSLLRESRRGSDYSIGDTETRSGGGDFRHTPDTQIISASSR